MPITIRCTECGKALRVKDESAGMRVKCPGCGGVIAVPRAEPEEEPAKVSQKPLRPVPPKAVEDEGDASGPRARALRRDEDDAPRKPRGVTARGRDVDEDEAPTRPRRSAPAGKQGKGMQALQAILGVVILVAIGLAMWWFFLRDGGGSSGGWRDFTSAEGNFKVRLPGEPTMETKTLPTPHGPITQKIYKVAFAKLREAYLAGYVDYPVEMAQAGASDIVRGELELLFNSPKRLRSKSKRDPWDLKPGMVAGEVTLVTQDEGTLRTRAIMVKQRLFLLVMNTPSSDSYDEIAKKFYDSFEIVGTVPDHFVLKKDDSGKDKNKGDDKDKEGGPKDKDDPKKKEGPKSGGSDFQGHSADIHAMALSPKGDRLATVSERDATLRVWEFPGGKEVHFAELRDDFRTPNSVAFSADGQLLAVGLGGPVEKLVLYDLGSKKEKKRIDIDRSATYLAFSADGQHLVFINAERAYRLDPKDPGKAEELGNARRGVLSPDGKRLFVSRGDDLRVIDLSTKKPLTTPPMKLTNVNALAVSGDGKLVAVAAKDAIHFWDVVAQVPLPGKEIKVPLQVENMALSEKGDLLAVRGGRQWQAYSLPEGKLLQAGKAEAGVEPILLTVDHRVVVNVGPTIQIHELKSKE